MPADTYLVHCHQCKGEFDAFQAEWCSCIVKERSLVCPSCLRCFCKSPLGYKRSFWSDAPRSLWERKLKEHRRDFSEPANPDPLEVTRPLVLIVEDEPEIRIVAIRAIKSLGYGVIIAVDGAKGLELATTYKPDLVLSDALMPKLDGREMCRQIKENSANTGVKTVIMTSLYTGARYTFEGIRDFVVDDYLAKPLDFKTLQEVLDRLLGGVTKGAERD